MVSKKIKIDFDLLSTFDLAFNLATGKYSELEKFEALQIIKERDLKQARNLTVVPEERKIKVPLKGSKAEKILKLVDSGKTAKEIYDLLNSKGIKVYYPEIYRFIKRTK